MSLESRIGYRFRDPDLLRQALTHTSAVKEGRSKGPDNQRLEFLGDAVLQLVMAHNLMERFPEQNEGVLSVLRAEMVRKGTLADVAEEIGLMENLLTGPSLEAAEKVAHRTVAADALEALLGAVYLEGGFEEARRVVMRIMGKLPEPGEHLKGAKSSLQEMLQKRHNGAVPRYETSEPGDLGGEDRFRAGVYLGDLLLGTGSGRSKKRAEEAAALAALHGMREE